MRFAAIQGFVCTKETRAGLNKTIMNKCPRVRNPESTCITISWTNNLKMHLKTPKFCFFKKCRHLLSLYRRPSKVILGKVTMAFYCLQCWFLQHGMFCFFSWCLWTFASVCPGDWPLSSNLPGTWKKTFI